MPHYDRIIHGGRVLDPANDLDAEMDVGIRQGRIAAVEPELAPSDTNDWIDVSGQWVLTRFYRLPRPCGRGRRGRRPRHRLPANGRGRRHHGD